MTNLARVFNLSKAVTSTILKDKDNVEVVNASKGVSRVSSQVAKILDDVEILLLIGIIDLLF